MDWNAAIERNREALKRVLATLVAMAGLDFEGQSAWFPQDSALPQGAAPAEGSRLSPALTLPRHLHRAVCKLLRPAEAAARRLIIVAARGLVVPPPRPRKPKPVTIVPLLRSAGIAVTMSPADLARIAAARRAAAERAARPRTLCLPLTDPLRKYRPWRPIARSVPRIWSLDTPFRPLPAPPSPDDPVSAARLALRLEALGRALDDLPREAKRFARWQARADAAFAQEKERYAAGGQLDRQLYGAGARNKSRDAAGAQDKKTRRRFPRIWPLKPGHPPGWRRQPTHEVHEVLNDLHYLAFSALEQRDTS